MKTITSTKIYLSVAALILTAALAIPAAAESLVPFKGALQGNDNDVGSNYPIHQVRTIGTGTGTHIGDFSFKQDSAINVVDGSATGSVHWMAANGDTIDTTFTALGGPTSAPPACPGLGDVFFGITEIHTITGGTGRFAGAHGTFIVERQASPVTSKTCGSIVHGIITSPGAAH